MITTFSSFGEIHKGSLVLNQSNPKEIGWADLVQNVELEKVQSIKLGWGEIKVKSKNDKKNNKNK